MKRFEQRPRTENGHTNVLAKLASFTFADLEKTAYFEQFNRPSTKF